MGGIKMIKEAVGSLVKNESLSREVAAQVMEEIMNGSATQAQIGAFLTALAIKGESPEEVAGMASVMRAKAIPVKVLGPLLDIVGTGGDGLNTFNISTTAAFVVAGAGLKVAKHGNRAASGKCGSADVLEKLGVKISLTADQVEKCIAEIGIGFMFAAAFHPAMKQVAGPRREIGIRSVFNILGPLTNPADAQYMLLGVPSRELAEKIVPALLQLPFKHVLVVSGKNGMDEITTTDSSLVWEIKGHSLTPAIPIYPEDFGFTRGKIEVLMGGSPEKNAAIVKDVLSGEKGACRDIVVINAAAALLAGNIVDSLMEGVKLAQAFIDNGEALAKLNGLVALTNSF
jgi:anthranilate phosphoribosyltransferase